jgi:hypothetical protein
MDSTEVIILAFSLIFVGLTGFVFVRKIIEKKRNESVLNYFKQVLPETELIKSNEKFFQYCFEFNNSIYLIKVLPFDLQHELIITNQYYWCINADLKGWKRSTIPDLFPGVREFLNYNVDTQKKVVKMALILPDCHNIIRYLNESDVAKVKPTDLVYGVYFVKAIELNLFFNKTK